MHELKFGIIGLSPGNGHPYSWAAICNGYNPEVMKDCPFKGIPRYLAERKFPEEAIPDVRVSHVWTQDEKTSRHIAAASLIENVVSDYSKMIGEVDAVLLARDDAENHYAIAKPLIESGLRIYIDKPLAYDKTEAERIYDLQVYDDQIFTCSALAYAPELQLTPEDREFIGPIRVVEAEVVKDWDKYAVHIIEPVLNIIGRDRKIRKVKAEGNGDGRCVATFWDNGLVTIFKSLGSQPGGIVINIVGDRGSKRLEFNDAFTAFRSALQEFAAVVRKGKPAPRRDHVLQVVEIIEAGRKG